LSYAPQSVLGGKTIFDCSTSRGWRKLALCPWTVILGRAFAILVERNECIRAYTVWRTPFKDLRPTLNW